MCVVLPTRGEPHRPIVDLPGTSTRLHVWRACVLMRVVLVCRMFLAMLERVVANEPEHETLSYGGNSIGEMEAAALRDALKENTSLSTLNLWGNLIECANAGTVIEAVKDHPRISTFSLQFNKIRCPGTCRVAELLECNPHITSLSLGDNEIKDEGILRLARAIKYNESLVNLSMWSNAIGAPGTKRLCGAMGAEYAHGLYEGVRVEKRHGGSQDRGVVRSVNDFIQRCDVVMADGSVREKVPIGDLRVDPVERATNRSIRTLNLEHNQFGEFGAASLANMLCHNTSLTVIEISNNAIGDEGARSIANMLPGTKTLRNLQVCSVCKCTRA